MRTHAFVAIYQLANPGLASLAAVFVPPGEGDDQEGRIVVVARMAEGWNKQEPKPTNGSAMIEALSGAVSTLARREAKEAHIWCNLEQTVTAWNRWQRGEVVPPVNARAGITIARDIRARVGFLPNAVASDRLRKAQATARACFEHAARKLAPAAEPTANSPADVGYDGRRPLRGDASNKRGREQ